MVAKSLLAFFKQDEHDDDFFNILSESETILNALENILNIAYKIRTYESNEKKSAKIRYFANNYEWCGLKMNKIYLIKK